MMSPELAVIAAAHRGTVWRSDRAAIETYLREMGVALDDVADAVDRSHERWWKVDTAHPTWQRMLTRAAASAASPWAPLHAIAAEPATDPATTLAKIDAWVAGLPASRVEQARAYIARVPPELADLPNWAAEFNNDRSRMLGKPTVPLNRASVVPDRVVVLSLDSRPDRWEALNASAARSRYFRGWPAIERYRARPPSEMIVPDWWTWGDTVYATGMDHRAIIEQSYVAGHQSVLILEDDAIIQDDFDAAYKLACRSLPTDWMGLWLTSDGHQKRPERVAPGLVRCRDQAMLHAYMLSRRGMRRVWHHLTTCYRQIIDGATEDLHGIEPHFYATETNAVRQFGCRLKGDRTDFYDQPSTPQ